MLNTRYFIPFLVILNIGWLISCEKGSQKGEFTANVTDNRVTETTQLIETGPNLAVEPSIQKLQLVKLILGSGLDEATKVQAINFVESYPLEASTNIQEDINGILAGLMKLMPTSAPEAFGLMVASADSLASNLEDKNAQTDTAQIQKIRKEIVESTIKQTAVQKHIPEATFLAVLEKVLREKPDSIVAKILTLEQTSEITEQNGIQELLEQVRKEESYKGDDAEFVEKMKTVHLNLNNADFKSVVFETIEAIFPNQKDKEALFEFVESIDLTSTQDLKNLQTLFIDPLAKKMKDLGDKELVMQVLGAVVLESVKSLEGGTPKRLLGAKQKNLGSLILSAGQKAGVEQEKIDTEAIRTAKASGFWGEDDELEATEILPSTVGGNLANKPPVLTLPGNQTVNEGATLENITILLDDEDSSLDCASAFRIKTSNADIINEEKVVTAGVAPDCKLSVTPEPEAFGVVTLTLGANDEDSSTVGSLTIEVMPVNDPPTVSAIDSLSIAEDSANNSVAFQIEDIDSVLACDTSVTVDSSAPLIVKPEDILILGEAPNCRLEVTPESDQHGVTSILVTVSDGSLLDSAEFELTVSPKNDMPTNINLSSHSIEENLGDSAVVGELSTEDKDVNDSHLYALTPGEGANDNDFFEIFENKLRAKSSLDFEARNTYSIRISSTDSQGFNISKPFTIIVTDIVEGIAPLIDTKETLLIEPGARRVLTSSDLLATHNSKTNAEITYIIESTPSHGALYHRIRRLNIGDTFTQDDINRFRIAYKHETKKSQDDSFTFSTHNGEFIFAYGATKDSPATMAIDAENFCEQGSRYQATSYNEIGSGPYDICTVAQLQDLAANCNTAQDAACGLDFNLRTSLDFKGIDFPMIGEGTDKYTGIFDGRGHSILNLALLDKTRSIGFFSATAGNATIKDLGIENGSLTNASNITGGGLLVGFATGNSQILRCFSTGSVDMSSLSQYTGGLVGQAYGSVSGSWSTADVIGYSRTGGLVGMGGGTSGSVNISDSWASGTINFNNNASRAGGLVGYIQNSTISHSHAFGTVYGYFELGGLLGESLGSHSIEFSSATGDIHATGGNAGGLIGKAPYDAGSIIHSFATGNVFGQSQPVGGLVGSLSGVVRNSFATGNVEGSFGNGGGLIGSYYSSGTHDNNDNYATGRVYESGGNTLVGGLVGQMGGFTNYSFSRVYATGGVESSSRFVGGIAGSITRGTIAQAFAIGGSIKGQENVGSLAGQVTSSGSILNSFAENDVFGDRYVSGFIGYFGGTEDIQNNLSLSAVELLVNGNEAGGFVGNTNNVTGGNFINNLAYGSVSGNGLIGGFLGNYVGTYGFSGNFWNTTGNTANEYRDGNGASIVNEIIAANSEELALVSTYDETPNFSWDFVNQWFPPENGNPPMPRGLPSHPCLKYTTATTWNEIGTGPYTICTVAQLDDIASNCNATDSTGCNQDFILGISLQYEGNTFAMIGHHDNPYTGTFDGNDQTINDVTISASETDVGFFRNVGNDGVVQDLTLLRMSVTNTGSANSNTGGLAGVNSGSITNVGIKGRGTGPHINSQGNNTGGLVGLNSGSIRNVWSTVHVKATSGGPSNFGGLIGRATGGTVRAAWSSGAVEGVYRVGGLIGINEAALSDSYATGIASGYDFVGGLVGENTTSGSIIYSHALGRITTAQQKAGGLVGQNAGSISKSYAKGGVSTILANFIGGLVGYNTGSISHSFSTKGSVEGNQDVGGLVGYQSGAGATISKSFSDTAVVGNLRVGGFVGTLESNSSTTDTWASGSVNFQGSSPAVAGGFAGSINDSSIRDSFTYGDVIAAGGTDKGGFIGTVSGTNNLSANFWDTDTSSQSGAYAGSGVSVSGIVGETTINMKTAATFSSWDTTDIWYIGTDSAYPNLMQEIASYY